ncbi:leucine-rich repeat domain-containing protein [Clostridium sp. SHJSY1]|uniref:leucine-rich repeat domain-containing protein n=1 Tax=Clostridium sp. SHJSY1 TaxID=2942483 RepID=UPI002876BB9E|nr:leucine-rich repeat domain-containing protein [Clostridium sp. SHJSY1]MDS0526290.1 leucine-rich repeat domain-containing protein [Clostridium sp. SHJSY1]
MEAGFIIKNGILERYTLREAKVIVPEKVKVIGKGAFKGCASIEEIILPETITDIMDTAFKGCRKLKKINFPSNLKFIGEYAFHRCHSLERVELPLSIKSLSNCVFLYCDNLEYVSMLGIKHLGKQVFSNDVNLKNVEVSCDLDISSICDVFTGCGKISKITLSDGAIFNMESAIEIISSNSDVHPVIKAIAKDIYRMMEIENGILSRFLINVKDIDVPKGITAIGKSCFFDKKGVISIKLPKTLTEIGSRAFRNCINLERIEFANDKVNISSDAFKNCTTLKFITLSDGSTYEIKGHLNTYDENIHPIVHIIHSQLLNNFFISGTTLIKYRGNEERVAVPEGITVIGEKAFAGNEAIGRVILPRSIKEIHEGAFMDCLLLQTINLQEGLEKLGESAFENCVKIKSIELPETLTLIEKSTFNRCKNLSDVRFGNQLREISNQAFYGCNSLKNIQFPEKLKSIGDLAFYKCSCIKEIYLPKSLNRLGNNVFTKSGIRQAIIDCDSKECGTDILSECNKLNKLTFCDGVKSIGDKFAFRCTSLKYVNLPKSIEYIGRNAFEDSIYIKNNIEDSNIFMDGKSLSGDVVIPEGTTIIAGGAFYGNTKITSIKLPKSLKRIGARCFCGCTSIKEVILPNSIAKLEEGVFSYCTSLEKVIAEGEITYIHDNAFYGCSEILKVPSRDALYIGENAFSGCKRLENIMVNCVDIQADAFRNTAFLEKLKSNSKLVIISNTVVDGKEFVGEIIIPEGVVNILPYAFSRNDNITSVVFPQSLINIGEGAFSGCRNIKKVDFPASLRNIAKRAFEKCVSLIEVGGYVQEIGTGTFSYCTNLKYITFKGTTTFGKEAFCGCRSLEVCKCKELEHIGKGCFYECKSLKNFEFKNIKQIEEEAFYGCISLKCICLNSTTYISAHCFEDCSGLEKIRLTSEAFIFGSYAFAGCTAIKEIGIEDIYYSTEDYLVILKKEIPDIIKEIYSNAMSCFDIDENLSILRYINKGVCIHIPNGIKRIENEVFKDAMTLEEIYIPESVEYIGERAFYNTTWLENKRIENDMVIINNILIDASFCKGDVIIPDYVKLVSGWAFVNCYDLTGVTFSSSKTIIEQYAFRNCINLKKVVTADGKEYKLENISDRDNEALHKSVKQIFMDCLNCFKTNESNKLVECTGNIKKLNLIDGITDIGDNVFKSSHLLTYINLTKDTEIIGKSAFEQCKSLVSVKNAESVKRIEKFAFQACYSLESIELSDKLEYIGLRAFDNCSSLKNIIIPEGITEIPEKTFYRCKSLERVVLPSTLKNIRKEAFAFCYSLKEINFPIGLESIESRTFAWCSNLNSKKLLENTLVEDDSFSFGGEL